MTDLHYLSIRIIELEYQLHEIHALIKYHESSLHDKQLQIDILQDNAIVTKGTIQQLKRLYDNYSLYDTPEY